MEKATAQDRSNASAADQAANLASAPEPTPVPVRSAKEAINAMYAQDVDKRLSSYLAASAKEIINAGSRSTDGSKSAANLHRGSSHHKLVSARPSASGILRTARAEPPRAPSDVSKSMDPLARKTTTPPATKVPVTEHPANPVVKTSLKLAPKKAPIVSTPQHLQNAAPRTSTLNSQKGQTALSKLLASRRATQATAAQTAPTPTPDTQEQIRVIQQATQKVTQSGSASHPKSRPPRGLMQDIVRPQRPTKTSRPVQSTQPTNIPDDSIKHRFHSAPKDYTAEPEVQTNSYQGFAIDEQEPISAKQPVEIYGLMDEEPTGKSTESLGVVEDYSPQGDTVSEGFSEQKVARGSGKAADNNKYALGGQSPFFLKSVNVEKRPLSDAPPRAKGSSEGTIYEHPSSEPVSKKNVYTKKEPKKPLPTKPTVIIPASRRSKAPFIILLLLTVILGAAVGAFVYLCFFQYME